MNKALIALSLAAGLLGGMLSRYLTPIPVHAQAQLPLNDSATPLAGAQTLKLPISLDQSGNIVGAFMMDPDGKPNILLYDSSWRSKSGPGRVIWSARGATVQPASGQ